MQTAEEEEFREFVVGCRHRLLRTAYALCGNRDRAEDLVQVTLVRTYRSWQRIRRREAPEAYARKVLVNLNIRWWQGRARRGEQLTAAVPDLAAPQPELDFEGQDLLWRAIQSLPPRMRAVVVLRYLEELKEYEAAEVLGCSVGTVKSQTSRALTKLRHILTEQDESKSTGPLRPAIDLESGR